MSDSQNRYVQSGQTVYGHQLNIAGNVGDNVKIELPPIEPSAAVAPPPPLDFVGREEQLAQLAKILIEGQSATITALHGMGGIGKTALAQQLADRLKPDFPGGIFWGDLGMHGGGVETILRAWGAICGADFSQEPDPAVLSERLRGLLAMRQDAQGALLAVLDDVRSEWLDGAKLLQKSLPIGTPLLVTMRDVDLAVALDAEVVRLDVLPERDAQELLAARVKPKEILTPEETVKALLQHLGYLPLAIRLAAGHVSKFARKPGFELGQFVDDVAQRAVSLLDTAGGAGLAATFAISYDALSEEQQRVFHYCSVYSAPLLTMEHMAGLLEMEEVAVEAALDDLVEVALLDWDREVKGRYALHPLLRQYGYEQLKHQEGLISVHRAAAEFLYSQRSVRVRSPEEGLEEVDQWRKASEQQKFALRAAKLVGTLDKIGYWDEIAQRLEAASQVLSDSEVDPIHLTLRSAVLVNWATIQYRRGFWDDAANICERAWSVAFSSDDDYSKAAVLNVRAVIFSHRGEHERALTECQKALEFVEMTDNLDILIQILVSLATSNVLVGNLDEALQLYQRALKVQKQDRDLQNKALINTNIAQIYQMKNEWSKAISYYSDSLSVFKQLNDLHSQGLTLVNLGTIHIDLGNWRIAKETIEQAIDLLDLVGDKLGVAKALGGLGNIARQTNSFELAIHYYENALSVFELYGDVNNLGRTYTNLGASYRPSNLSKARSYYEQAIKVLEKTGDVYALASAHNNIGNVCIELKDWIHAEQSFVKALKILEQLGDTKGTTHPLNGLGLMHMRRANWAEALTYMEQALERQKQVNDRPGMGITLYNLGLTSYWAGNVDIAAQVIGQSIFAFNSLGLTVQAQQAANILIEMLGSPEAAREFINTMVSSSSDNSSLP